MRWIMAGKVIVNGQRVDKPGTLVPEDADVRIKDMKKYVGRGGLKLEAALKVFGVDVEGRVALDCGASTGGFTDCLLRHGAEKVYAVDAGYGMLAGKLRADRRVVNLERTNIGDLSHGQFDPVPSLAVVDLSYLSLKEALPLIMPLLAPSAEILCLVKPLFEIADPDARRTGRIEDGAAYARIVEELGEHARSLGLEQMGVIRSPVLGRKGTTEFFLWLRCR